MDRISSHLSLVDNGGQPSALPTPWARHEQSTLSSDHASQGAASGVFFPDEDNFPYLEAHLLPALLRERSALRIWCVGCGDGGVAYSLAILLHDLAPQGRHWILATERHDAELTRARSGADVRANEIAAVNPTRRAAHLRRQPDGTFRVRRASRAFLDFRTHNHLRSAAAKDLDLIVYSHEPQMLSVGDQRRLSKRLLGALRSGGILYTGVDSLVNGPVPDRGKLAAEKTLQRVSGDTPRPHLFPAGA